MTQTKHTKRALLVSALSMLLCFSMLLGTTYAWFTDSVSSANNIIKSGNLDVDVYYGDPTQEQSVEGVSTLFSAVERWEPGAVAYENLTVANKGSLALKYRMTVSFTNENYMVDGDYALSDILMVALVEGGVDETLTREQLIASIPEDGWTLIEDFSLSGDIQAKTNDETVGLVIWWAPSNSDDNFNVKNGKVTSDGADYLHIDMGITLVATQYTYEEDSFDETYDKDAEYPIVVSGTLDDTLLDDALVLKAGRVTVKIPKTAPYGNYKLDVSSLSITTDENGDSTLDVNINLMKDGVKVTPGAAEYDVEIDLELMSAIDALYHNGDQIQYQYDPFTGIISFKTTSFSPFSVEYDVFGTEVVVDAEKRKITRGFFEEVNPATLDASLLGDDSEYIAVDYVKNGVKYYAVSARATTVILGDADDGGSGYTFENGSYPVKMISDNALYSEISALQKNAHSTVYILPGIYEPNTAVNVYSSMDIVGLGNAEDIQIIKVKGSYSNRHLFNCNGAVTRNEHIQVTIRNLYLDANAKNLNSAGKFYLTDNAAVQSIRMSKVKCYDLIISKSSGFAFYVNGKYDARGAYLYAENCTMTTNSVVDTASTYRFYYNNLTYGKGAYTTSTSYIKNTVLAWDDWDWVK